MKDSLWLKRKLEELKAFIVCSHLVLTSGKHSDCYINLRVLAGHVSVLWEIGRMIAAAINKRERETNHTRSHEDYQKRIVLVGPETLGRTLAEFAAISGGSEYFAWCDMKKDNDISIAEWNPKLNFAEMVNGARCYIIDDLLTTAKSVKLVKQLIENTGGQVDGVVVVVRRDQEVTAETVDVPWLCSLLDVEGFNVYEAGSCRLCEAKVPMKPRPGHGHEWIEKNKDYPVAE